MNPNLSKLIKLRQEKDGLLDKIAEYSSFIDDYKFYRILFSITLCMMVPAAAFLAYIILTHTNFTGTGGAGLFMLVITASLTVGIIQLSTYLIKHYKRKQSLINNMKHDIEDTLDIIYEEEVSINKALQSYVLSDMNNLEKRDTLTFNDKLKTIHRCTTILTSMYKHFSPKLNQ